MAEKKQDKTPGEGTGQKNQTPAADPTKDRKIPRFANPLTEPMQTKRETLEGLLDMLQAAVFGVDSEGHIFYANPAASRMMKYSREQLTHMEVSNLDMSFRVEDWQAHIKCIDNDMPRTFETQVRTGDGRQIWIEGQTARARLDDNTLVEYPILTDITERKLHEMDDHRKIDFLTKVFAGTGVGVMVSEIEPDGTEKIVMANPCATQLFGKRVEQIVGADIRLLIPEDSATHAKVRQETQTRIQTGVSGSYEIEIQTPDGEKRTLRVLAAPIQNSAGEVDRTMACFLDISKQKEEERIRDKQARQNIQRMISKNTEHFFTTAITQIALGVEVTNVLQKKIQEAFGRSRELVDRTAMQVQRNEKGKLCIEFDEDIQVEQWVQEYRTLQKDLTQYHDQMLRTSESIRSGANELTLMLEGNRIITDDRVGNIQVRPLIKSAIAFCTEGQAIGGAAAMRKRIQIAEGLSETSIYANPAELHELMVELLGTMIRETPADIPIQIGWKKIDPTAITAERTRIEIWVPIGNKQSGLILSTWDFVAKTRERIESCNATVETRPIIRDGQSVVEVRFEFDRTEEGHQTAHYRRMKTRMDSE